MLSSLPALLRLRFSACASHLSVVVRPIHHQFHILSPYKILLIPYLGNYFVLPQIVDTVFNYFGVPYFLFFRGRGSADPSALLVTEPGRTSP